MRTEDSPSPEPFILSLSKDEGRRLADSEKANTRLRHHLVESGADDRLCLADDAIHQFLARRNVVDQPLRLAGRPDSVIGVAGVVDLAAACSGDEIAHILELGI